MKSSGTIVIKDKTSPSGYSTLQTNGVITHLKYGEMPFILTGGFGHIKKK